MKFFWCGCCVLLLTTAAASKTLAGSASRYRVLVREDGVYQLTYRMLADAGLSGAPASESLALFNRGQPVALWLEDGGDGFFGPGDWIEFVGSHLPGEHSYYHDYSPFNVYHLDIDAEGGRRIQPLIASGSSEPWRFGYLSGLHIEKDNLRAELTPRHAEPAGDCWYWYKIHQLSPAPFRHALRLDAFDAQSRLPTEIKLQIRGWSDTPDAANGVKDHVVEFAANGRILGSGYGTGRDIFRISALLDHDQAKSVLTHDANTLTVKVPRRVSPVDGEPIIDVVYLDWLEVSYPRRMETRFGQFQVDFPVQVNQSDRRWSRHVGTGPELPVVYTDDNRRVAAKPYNSENGDFYFDLPTNARRVWVSTRNQLRKPDGVSAVEPRPSPLVESPVDYLMIVHPELMTGIRPLAAYHRDQGLAVAVVDVFDIYDHFNHGIIDPAAIRRFIHDVIARQAPSILRFVLLVGDASWHHKYEWDPYVPRNWSGNRNKIPSWSVPAYDGLAASDNPFVSESSRNTQPRVAIGRLPVASLEELRGVVGKLLTYARNQGDPSWRGRALLLSGDSLLDRNRNRRLAVRLNQEGISVAEIRYRPDPRKDFAAELRAGLDKGVALVHFFGHGGRYMWQTGSPRLSDTKDLFQMEDLDRLRPRGDWPFILSMTCSSGPFDHPRADSLAERLFRLPDRGAIAVLASSARNAPPPRFSQAIIEHLMQGETMGDAVMGAKRAIPSDTMRQHYNLFGDPALSIPLPE